jgi:outer membrane biosynthesis protein TonB
MSNDNKHEQSVMIPLDELLAQDPSLGAHLTPQSQSSVDQKKLDRVGLNRGIHQAAAPLNNVVVPMRRTEVHTKRGPGKLLSVVSIIIGITALIAVGIFIGGIINKQEIEKMNVVPAAQMSPGKMNRSQPQKPAPRPATKIAPAAAVTQTPEAAKPAVATQTPETAKAAAKTNKRSKRRRAKSKRPAKAQPKPEPQAQAAPEPKPAPKAAPKPAPKPSEASSLLSGLKSGKKRGAASGGGGSANSVDSSLPAKLERSQILSVLRKNRRSVTRCASHVTEKTRVKMRMIIAGSGKVSSATLHEPANLKNSPLAQCMSGRVKLFKFPAFGSSSMTVKLPFILQKK